MVKFVSGFGLRAYKRDYINELIVLLEKIKVADKINVNQLIIEQLYFTTNRSEIKSHLMLKAKFLS